MFHGVGATRAKITPQTYGRAEFYLRMGTGVSLRFRVNVREWWALRLVLIASFRYPVL